MNSSLVEIIRKRFLETIRSVQPPGKWKILVVDEHAQKLLGAVLKTYDVLEENVTLIESVNSNRTPQPQFEAMYLLMPTTANIERIIDDFGGPRRDRQPQYAGAHLFFMDGLAEPLFERLTSSPAEPYLKQLVDLFLNFSAIESRVFSLNTPEMFFSTFSPPRDPQRAPKRLQRLEDDLRFTAKTILNVLINLNENPLIRYYQPTHHGPLGPLASNSSTDTIQAVQPSDSSSSRWARSAALRRVGVGEEPIPPGVQLPEKLARMVQAELDEYRKGNSDWPKPDPSRPRGVLIITDRTMDAVAPFLHEFTYQAMANDLLKIDNGRVYHYKFQSAMGKFEDKKATLTDADQIWTQVRHMHMREAIDKLMSDFNKFLEEHAGFKGGEGATSLNDMKDMLANLPQYQEQREKFSLHLTMAQECMDLFEQRKLPSTASVEQNCATGQTAEGKSPKHLVEEMVPLLDDKSVSSRDKVRIIALYIMHRDGVPEEDQRRLFQHARLSLAEQDAVRNLSRLGVRTTRGPGDKDTKKRLKFKNTSTEEEYELSRYQPLVQSVIAEHVAGKLDVTSFPYVRDAPTQFASSLASNTPSASRLGANSPAAPTSLRSAKPSWHRAPRTGSGVSKEANGSEKDPIRQRVLCFIAGGATYSEIRAAYNLTKDLNRDVYIGTTHMITPERFIDDLKVLEMEGIGSAAVPNGLPNVSSGEAGYQGYYDKRYFTPDAPAPPPPPSVSKMPPSSGRGASSGGSRLAPPPLPSPTPSNSSLSTKEGKEKKKKGLFRF